MIGYIRGKILDQVDGRMLVAIGGTMDAAGAIGYSIAVPQNRIYEGLLCGSMVELFVYTHVREDALDLYGFSTKAEKDLFLTLLSVNGIGPKSALGIISGADADALIHAIIEGDKVYLSKLPGIGKKTAERVVLELADVVRKKMQAGVFGNARAHAAGATAGKGPFTRTSESAVVRDARAALIGLGYREVDVNPLLNQVIAGLGGPPEKAEDLIRSALRQLV